MVGTEQGLYARAVALAAPVLRLRSTIDDGSCLEQEFPLDADLLAKVSLCPEFLGRAGLMKQQVHRMQSAPDAGGCGVEAGWLRGMQ